MVWGPVSVPLTGDLAPSRASTKGLLMMTTRSLFPALTLALIFLLWMWGWRSSPLPVHAQAPAGLCDQHKAMASTPSGSSFTVASALSNQTVYVCGYVLGGDAATTAVTFQSNGTSITGPIRI